MQNRVQKKTIWTSYIRKIRFRFISVFDVLYLYKPWFRTSLDSLPV